MRVVSARERAPQSAILGDLATSFYRRAEAPRLGEILGSIGRLAIPGNGLELPTNYKGDISPKVMVIAGKEIRQAPEQIRSTMTDPSTPRALQAMIPELGAGKTVIANRLINRTNRKGERFLLLGFDGESSKDFRDEREAIQGELACIAGLQEETVQWQDYDLEMKVLFCEQKVEDRVAGSIASFINKKLPLTIELSPMFQPSIAMDQPERLAA